MISRREALMGTMALVLGPHRPGAEGHDQAAMRFELYRDSRGRFRWRLKAGNGRVIATANEAYNTKAACRQAIERVRSGAATAQVEELV